MSKPPYKSGGPGRGPSNGPSKGSSRPGSSHDGQSRGSFAGGKPGGKTSHKFGQKPGFKAKPDFKDAKPGSRSGEGEARGERGARGFGEGRRAPRDDRRGPADGARSDGENRYTSGGRSTSGGRTSNESRRGPDRGARDAGENRYTSGEGRRAPARGPRDAGENRYSSGEGRRGPGENRYTSGERGSGPAKPPRAGGENRYSAGERQHKPHAEPRNEGQGRYKAERPHRGPGDGPRDGGESRYKSAEGRYASGEGRSFRGRPESHTPRPIRKPGPAPRAAAPTPKDPSLPARDGERIAKLLARAGIASRREAERIIIEGRVKLGDQVIATPSTVLPSLKGVTVDGNPVQEAEGTRLFAFHKPAGLLTAERDPAGRPTIYEALRNALPDGAGRVMPIGRLDLNTEGLLLLTNDGEFKRQLELPATGVPRTYRARTFGDITQSRLEELMEGIEVDGVIYGKIDANMERRTGRNQWIVMTLTEGKNREVRRVLEALGLQVSRLIRVAYGPFVLGDMPKGTAGEVTAKDLENFRRTLPAIKA